MRECVCPFVLKESHTLDNILSTYAGKWLLLSYILEEKTIIFNATFFFSFSVTRVNVQNTFYLLAVDRGSIPVLQQDICVQELLQCRCI